MFVTFNEFKVVVKSLFPTIEFEYTNFTNKNHAGYSDILYTAYDGEFRNIIYSLNKKYLIVQSGINIEDYLDI